MIPFDILAGFDDQCIDYSACEVPVHGDLVAAVGALRARAKDAGLDLALASGYRSFARQLSIWNEKATGRRALLDDQGQPLDIGNLTPTQRLFAILRWSALPGASRHHWGTDIDVYDAAPSAQSGYKLQLTVEETLPDAVYGRFYQWLNRELLDSRSGFFRPYQQSEGGVAPEPWHLSYAPLAASCQRSFQPDQLKQRLLETDIALKEQILTHFEEIIERFVRVDWALYPAQ